MAQGERLPIETRNATITNSFHVQESKALEAEADRISKILDAKYRPADITEVCKDTLHLSDSEKQLLEQLLREYEDLFDGTLGEWKGRPHHIQLKEGATPYHGRAYPAPKAY